MFLKIFFSAELLKFIDVSCMCTFIDLFMYLMSFIYFNSKCFILNQFLKIL